ncbi:hypothetical protein [Microtetraspora sp. NBRC 13810]|nr:hypothetical protein [Microtetraspora sp. NBRC 13810]
MYVGETPAQPARASFDALLVPTGGDACQRRSASVGRFVPGLGRVRG